VAKGILMSTNNSTHTIQIETTSKDGMSIIAAKDLNAVYGGAIFDAIKLDLSAKIDGGVLTEDNVVYFLNCQK
jgi:hypothetical protein